MPPLLTIFLFLPLISATAHGLQTDSVLGAQKREKEEGVTTFEKEEGGVTGEKLSNVGDSVSTRGKRSDGG